MGKTVEQRYISPRQIRRIILDQSKRAHVGHIGSALSIADIVAVLYQNVLSIPDPDDPDRDRFMLSKGHAVLAVYAVLFLKGWLTEQKLNTYCANGPLLGLHPEHPLLGLDFSTGSLGHGLCGAARRRAASLRRDRLAVQLEGLQDVPEPGGMRASLPFGPRAFHRLRDNGGPHRVAGGLSRPYASAGARRRRARLPNVGGSISCRADGV